MHIRAVRTIVSIVAVVCALMGMPGTFLASASIWSSEQRSLDVQAQLILQNIECRRTVGEGNDPTILVSLVTGQVNSRGDEFGYHIKVPEANFVTNSKVLPGRTTTVLASSPNGVSMQLTASVSNALSRIARTCAMFGGGMVASSVIGWVLTHSLLRELSAPLIYLTAQVEQIGLGDVRARVEKSGIKEVDLVSEELAHTDKHMTGRLAAERQVAADTSHRLCTPLTALSMRLEEIELISTGDEVRAEARTCPEQMEHMTNVVTELLDIFKHQTSQTEAIHILEVFNTAREEWGDQFEAAGRPLILLDEAERPILADAEKLGQVLAILIGNSLRYDGGTTHVQAHTGTSKHDVVIEMSDEGEGIDESLASDVFQKGVSGHGSTGINLALTHNLAQAMSERPELGTNKPPVSTVPVAAVPTPLDSDRVIPEGPLMSMGRRSRRFQQRSILKGVEHEVLTPPTVAIIGGGQLARMMQKSTVAPDINLRALVEASDGSTGQTIVDKAVDEPTDLDVVRMLISSADVLTFEHEHIPAPTMREAARLISVRPPASALLYTQGKLAMHKHLTEMGIPYPTWACVRDEAQLAEFGATIGRPLVVEVPHGGYDGHGVAVAHSPADVSSWWGNGLLLAKALVPFAGKMAALLTRTPSSEIASWSVISTAQIGGVCTKVTTPAVGVRPETAAEAQRIGERIATKLDVTGVLAMKMPVVDESVDEHVLVNKLAMRPHNTGHWTIDGAVMSQFEQHLHAVLDLPLGSTQLRALGTHVIVANLFGSFHAQPTYALAAAFTAGGTGARAHLHDEEMRPRRRLDHVAVVNTGPALALECARTTVNALKSKTLANQPPRLSAAEGPGVPASFSLKRTTHGHRARHPADRHWR